MSKVSLNKPYTVPYPLALGLGFLALVFFSISVLCLLTCFCRCRPSKKKFHYKPMDHNLNDFNARVAFLVFYFIQKVILSRRKSNTN